MTRITVDDATASLLRWVKQPVEILDEQGRWIGTFTPVDQEELDCGIELPYTDEEIRGLKNQQGGRTLAKILADLGGRPADSGVYQDPDVPSTDEELDRFETEPGGRSLQEVLKEIEGCHERPGVSNCF
jgi:hypothetical protein